MSMMLVRFLSVSLGPVLLCLSLLVDMFSVISLPFFCRTFAFTVEGS